MKSDDKAGLYITVIFHLMVIIVLLVSQNILRAEEGEHFCAGFLQTGEG